MKGLYVAAASLLLVSPAYGQVRNGCKINEPQYQEARELMRKQIDLGRELREGKKDLIIEMCKLYGEHREHEIKYGLDGLALEDPRGCSSFHGMNDAFGFPYDERTSERIENADLTSKISKAFCQIPQF